MNNDMTDATIKRKPIYVYFLLSADSIKTMLGTCQKEVNYHWFSCDSWHPKGAPVACLGVFGKMSGIDDRRFLPSPHPLPLLLMFRTPSQFVSFAQVFFPTRSQFHSLRLSFWKHLLCRLTTTPSCPLLNW